MICLFGETETDFTSLGIKVLQPILCEITKEDNGDYKLELRDKADNFTLYNQDMIIAVDTPWSRQAFRISNVRLNGSKVDVDARHVFYDAENYLIEDNYVVEQDANYALNHLNTDTDQTSPFTTIGDVTAIRSLRTVRKSLLEAIGDLLERWGGHLTRDNYEIGVRDTIGQDRGVTIAYGKNITGFTIDEDWSDVATKVLPVGKDGLELASVYLENAPEDYPRPYSKVVSFDQGDIKEEDYRDENGDLDETAYNDALLDDLQAQATTYLAENHLPRVNYTLDAYLDGVNDIGDTIRVKHPRLTNDLITNVIAVRYNAISDRIEKVEFGNFNPKLSNLVGNTESALNNATESLQSAVISKFDNALLEATKSINSILGDSYVIYDGDEILVVDSLPKETATNVMRINAGGIGFSNTGIAGTFSSAWQIDGTMDMQAINVINLVADQIQGGSLRLGFYEGNSGIIEIFDEFGNEVGQLDENGLTLSDPNGDRLEISPTGGLSAYSSISGVEEEVFSIDRDVTDIAKLNARYQIQMTPIKIVPIASGDQAGWAFVKLDEGA